MRALIFPHSQGLATHSTSHISEPTKCRKWKQRAKQMCRPDKLEQLGSSLQKKTGGCSWGVVLVLRCTKGTVWRRNLGHSMQTYSVIRNSVYIHKAAGGQRTWSAVVTPREQPGISVLLKVTSKTEICMHTDSVTTGRPCCGKDSAGLTTQKSYLIN